MGCDIHPEVEVLVDGNWEHGNTPERLFDRTYGRFAFLTGGEVRNYDGVPEVLPKPRGLPSDRKLGYEDFGCDYSENHSASYLTLAELLAVDYDITLQALREPGTPTMTLKEFLGEKWQEILKELAEQGSPENVRIVFDFDN